LWLIDYHGRDVAVTQDGALKVETTPALRWRFFTRWFSACFSRRAVRRPDIIVASGDCYIGLVAYLAAFFCGSKFVFDVYDRYDVFEGYRRLPGFDPLSFLLRRSDMVMFASAKVHKDLGPLARKTALVPNAVDLARFRPLPMADSRRLIGLANNETLVGYFGSMEPDRGIDDLLNAVSMLREDGVDIGLVIGGRANTDISLDLPWVHYLGNLDFAKMPAALASCDLLALPYRQSEFMDAGSSCKIAEYVAVRRPIVATRTPNLTANFPDQSAQLEGVLATPGDATDLARCLQRQLGQRRLVQMPKDMSWQDVSARVLIKIENIDVARNNR
jgi:glycosyltransferase involved in cell wall biosynthesis